MSAASGQKKNEQLKLLSFVGAASHFGQSFAVRIVTRRKQMSAITCTKFGEIEKKEHMKTNIIRLGVMCCINNFEHYGFI